LRNTLDEFRFSHGTCTTPTPPQPGTTTRTPTGALAVAHSTDIPKKPSHGPRKECAVPYCYGSCYIAQMIDFPERPLYSTVACFRPKCLPRLPRLRRHWTPSAPS
jgi:hypothetical protein